MAKKKPRARTERREVERNAVKLAEARMKLAKLEVGGAPDRPIEVASASVVEPHASSLACTACGASVRVDEHVAVTLNVGGDAGGEPRALRIARVLCPRCGVRRDVYFRIGTVLPS